jgi:hypothetical protein
LNRSLLKSGVIAAALLAVGLPTVSVISASVIELNLRQMLERADSAVVGSVTARDSWHGPHQGFADGIDFTTITVEGEDLVQGGTVNQGGTVKRQITYLGSDTMPVSEMPTFADTKVGVRGVFFSKAVTGPWGGRNGLSSIIAADFGAFRIESGPKGEVVLGKGEGSAIATNAFVADIRKQVASELAQIRAEKK